MKLRKLKPKGALQPPPSLPLQPGPAGPVGGLPQCQWGLLVAEEVLIVVEPFGFPSQIRAGGFPAPGSFRE